jgi:thiosulfate reductase cytochrome b subunit
MTRAAFAYLLGLLSVFAAARATAQQSENPIHPTFRPLSSNGGLATTRADVSASATCGGCHDVAYIASHNQHGDGLHSASCIDCHLDRKVDLLALDDTGFLPRASLRIGPPAAENCAQCHGLVRGAGVAVAIPDDLAAPAGGVDALPLTLTEGAIISPAARGDSFLNFAGKSELDAPWDVHAAKLVDCVACHHAANNPARTDTRNQLAYLSFDPRQASPAAYLSRPDHRLAKRDCQSCHAPEKAHAFLPYRARHMEKLACQSCHVRAPLGPAAELVDETMFTRRKQPLVRYRNRPAVGEDLDNAAWLEPLVPTLVTRTSEDGRARLAPANLVTRFRWTSRAGDVPRETLLRAIFQGDDYAPALRAVLDADRDGALEPRELPLDTPEKVSVVRTRLEALGVVLPEIRGDIETHLLTHGMPGRAQALAECSACHSETKAAGSYLLAGYLPGGVVPTLRAREDLRIEGTLSQRGSTLVLERSPVARGLHVLGQSRDTWSNTLGFGIFALVAAALSVHAATRVLLRARQPARGVASPHAALERDYVFGWYERIWHWTMAASGIVLIATGLLIHTGTSGGRGLTTEVHIHNAAALLLMANAFLGFFYHSVTTAIRQFIPERAGLLRRLLDQVDYQARGIFYGGPHPRNAPGAKLNPLQQLTYLGLLNFLFPLQVASGVLMWVVGEWPSAEASVGALSAVAPLHNLGSWLFLTFFVLHVYLVTTGRTVSEHLTTMLTGYRERESAAEREPRP